MTWSGSTWVVALGIAGIFSSRCSSRLPPPRLPPRARIDATIRKALKAQGLNAVIEDVTIRGKTATKKAYGQR